MSEGKSFQQMADEAVARVMAEYEASRQPRALSPDEEVADRLSKARFRESIGEHALLHGVRPAAITHVVRDAETVFEMKDGALVPRNDATDPHDPVSPLSPSRWLEELRKTDAYLFTPDKQTEH